MNTYLILDENSLVLRLERADNLPGEGGLEENVTAVEIQDWTGWPEQPYKAAVLAYRDEKLVWEDPRDIAQAKDDQWALVKDARDTFINSGVTWDGSVFDSDAIAQGRVAGATTLALMAVMQGQAGAFSKTWKLADNSSRVLSAADMMAVGVTLGQMVQTAIDKGEAIRLQIYSSTSLEQIRSLTWQS